jgi:hypothetical protein
MPLLLLLLYLALLEQEFISGDGFGLPSPVPDMVVQGKTLPEAAAKWKDILFTTGAKAGDFLTGEWVFLSCWLGLGPGCARVRYVRLVPCSIRTICTAPGQATDGWV